MSKYKEKRNIGFTNLLDASIDLACTGYLLSGMARAASVLLLGNWTSGAIIK